MTSNGPDVHVVLVRDKALEPGAGACGTGRAERESRGSELRLACDGGFESISGGGDLLPEVSRDIRSGAVGEVLVSADS